MNDERPVPDWLLERLAQGELDAQTAERLRARLGAEALAARTAALADSDRQILAAHPPAAVVAEIERRAALPERPTVARPGRRWLSLVGAGALLATAGAAVVVLALRPQAPPADVAQGPGGAWADDPNADQVTVKGLRPHLIVYRKSAQGPVRLSPEAPVRAGDTLQVAYVGAGRRYGVVASVDGRGAVTLHLPEAEGTAPRLAERGETALPHAFQLDDSPGFERFVFVTADQPFSARTVLEALRPAGPPLPPEFSTVELTLRKTNDDSRSPQ